MWTVDAAPVVGGAAVVFVEPLVVGLVDPGAVDVVGFAGLDVLGACFEVGDVDRSVVGVVVVEEDAEP